MDDGQVLQKKEIGKYSITKNYSTGIFRKTLPQAVWWMLLYKQQSCMGVYIPNCYQVSQYQYLPTDC